jgi:TonB family protein
MTNSTSLALAIAVLGLLPSSAVAADQRAIVVTAPVSLAQWSTSVERSLDRTLTYPAPLRGPDPEGVVKVKFLCSESGTPTGITLAKSSGSRALDAAALRAVRRIKTLHPLPDGLSHSQIFQANILYASSERSHDRWMSALEEEAKRQNARVADRPREVAQNIVYLTVGGR